MRSCCPDHSTGRAEDQAAGAGANPYTARTLCTHGHQRAQPSASAERILPTLKLLRVKNDFASWWSCCSGLVKSPPVQWEIGACRRKTSSPTVLPKLVRRLGVGWGRPGSAGRTPVSGLIPAAQKSNGTLSMAAHAAYAPFTAGMSAIPRGVRRHSHGSFSAQSQTLGGYRFPVVPEVR